MPQTYTLLQRLQSAKGIQKRFKSQRLRPLEIIQSIPCEFDLKTIAVDYPVGKYAIGSSGFTYAFNGCRLSNRYVVRQDAIPLFNVRKLADFNLKTGGSTLINFDVSHAEDARCFRFKDHLCCLFGDGFSIWYGNVDTLECYKLQPPAEKAFKTDIREKNWSPFVYHDQLHVYYAPGRVIRYQGDQPQQEYITPAPTWDYGDIRGGTPLVEHAGKLYTIFHSRYKKFGRTIYLPGIMELEAEPPFCALRWSQTPLWLPKYDSRRANNFVTFPTGLEIDGTHAIIIAGCNDETDQEIRIPLTSLLGNLGSP